MGGQGHDTAQVLRPLPPPRYRRRLAGAIAGLILLLGGAALVIVPVWTWWHRGQADEDALAAWRNGGRDDIVGAVPGGAPSPPGSAPAGSASPPGTGCHPAGGDEALVLFPPHGGRAYAGVAGEGGWDLLRQRSMVHYHGSPEPGGAGNAVIGFHREPSYEHIDAVSVGDTVTIQDRRCRLFRYRVTDRWDLDPHSVTQLGPTGGRELTLVTCTPWLVDSRRLVWRAELVP